MSVSKTGTGCFVSARLTGGSVTAETDMWTFPFAANALCKSFKGDDIYKKVSVLSPGERARVALAKLSISGANLLLLDEPTNHLDPETQNIIGEVFNTFDGSMIVVSHNTEFVKKIGIERVLILPDGKIQYYDDRIVDYYHELNQRVKWL